MKFKGDMFGRITTRALVTNFVKSDRSFMLTTRGNWTNGHWILKPEYINNALMKRLKKTHRKTKVSEKGIYPAKVYPAKYHKSTFLYYKPMTIAIFVNTQGVYAGYDEKYIAYLTKTIPNFSLRFLAPTGVARIMSGKKIAGALMPIRPDSFMEDGGMK